MLREQPDQDLQCLPYYYDICDILPSTYIKGILILYANNGNYSAPDKKG